MQQEGGKEKFRVRQPQTAVGSNCSPGQDPATARGAGRARGGPGGEQRWGRESFPRGLTDGSGTNQPNRPL